LDRGADVNMPVQGDGNPLIAAAREGAVSVVQLLLDRGASIDQIVPGDETALIQASAEGHLGVVKLLVARGANVNLGVWVEQSYPRSEKEWRSPLSMARKGRHASVVEFLRPARPRGSCRHARPFVEQSSTCGV
jgi:ankyrin repeat protein